MFGSARDYKIWNPQSLFETNGAIFTPVTVKCHFKQQSSLKVTNLSSGSAGQLTMPALNAHGQEWHKWSQAGLTSPGAQTIVLCEKHRVAWPSIAHLVIS